MFRFGKILPLLLVMVALFWVNSSPLAEKWPAGNAALPITANALFAPEATCTHTHDADGVPLDQCYGQTFTIGTNTRSVSVYYTLSTTHDGSPHNHWINSLAEAQDVADWAQEAWERYYQDAGVEPYTTGCGGNIDYLIRQGVGWAGIAYWASSGNCNIGIDAPMIRGGGGRGVTYHETQHYEQYGFTDCYEDWQAGYSGNAEFVEGYADYGPSTVDNSGWYNGNSYNAASSMYNKDYGNRFVIYLSEQISAGLGVNGSPGDAWYRSNGMYEHYRECGAQDDLYVERDIVQANTPYSYEEFFMNFFAANWANDWASAATQPELHYYEEDIGIGLTSPTLTADVSLSGGSQSWAGQSTPDTWAGKYYQVRPQSGCSYLTLDVDGQSGAKLGISLMGANTSGPSLVRSARVGEDFVRTFAAHGVNNRLAAVVNAFNHNYTYAVTATCVSPHLEILEPKQTKFALVGDPTSPIAFLGRFRVTSAGNPVRGLVESSFNFDAEGGTVTVAPGSLQEVGGGEYWATLLPPTKPAGTTFVDFRACLDTICDTENNALLYVAPGNSDIIILHDESGSMSTEDVIGEGTRLANAQKAATVWANLAQSGDRYGVMGFSAKDNPGGCGLPYGSGNCQLDIKTHLPRTSITNPATQIPLIETAINATEALEWTPVGAGLDAAKTALETAPTGTNPKYIILLSDGEENVNPLYGDASSGVQDKMIESGIAVNTIGFSGDAPSALLAQIAADTGGIFRYVPASTADARIPDAADTLTGDSMAAALISAGMAADSAQSISKVLAPASTHYPANLGLADVYDYYETRAQGAARLSHAMYVLSLNNSWKEQSMLVDSSVNLLRLVSAGRQWDADVDDVCEGYHREVAVLQPGAGERDWIPVSPVNEKLPPPSTWDIRNSYYVDVVLIPNPAPGTWKMRTRYVYGVCKEGSPAKIEGTEALESDFMMNGSVQSLIRLEGRFLAPFEDNQGLTGDHVPVVAALMQKTGTLSGALVVAVVEKPGGGQNTIWLRDDGKHNDGAASDGIYGTKYTMATIGGAYNVRMGALFPDPANPGQNLWREWLGSFYAKGPSGSDNQDDDVFPPWWEERYPCMNPKTYNNPQADYDQDGAINMTEWNYGTNPCDPDTDDGGEKDGSEINGQRDPHGPGDDKVGPVWNFSIKPLNKAILVRWSHPLSYTRMMLNIEGIGSVNMGRTGMFTYSLRNDAPYSITLNGETADGQGAPTAMQVVTPKEDPDAPSGFIQINQGAPQTTSKSVTLTVNVSDVPIGGLASAESAATVANAWTPFNTVSGVAQMRFSNNPAESWTRWETYATTRAWTLPATCPAGQLCMVYAQFKDNAGNESMTVFDTILLEAAKVYLPVILK